MRYYKWQAWIEGKLIKEGIREISTEHLFTYHKTYNIDTAILNWNRIAEIQNKAKKYPPRILWKYQAL